MLWLLLYIKKFWWTETMMNSGLITKLKPFNIKPHWYFLKYCIRWKFSLEFILAVCGELQKFTKSNTAKVSFNCPMHVKIQCYCWTTIAFANIKSASQSLRKYWFAKLNSR